jgi:hypothetical protein
VKRAKSWSDIDVASYEGGDMTAAVLVARLERRYQETANPLCVWFALRACLQEDLPLPAFVTGYLLSAATDICRLAEMDEEGTYREPARYVRPASETLRGDRESRARSVIAALRLHPEGRGRKRDAFEQWCPRREDLVVGLVGLARDHGMTKQQAIELVALRWRVSLDTVRHYLESATKKLP